MAIAALPRTNTRAKTAVGEAYWQGSISLEDLALDAERLAETAYCLACSEAFEENAQHSFYALALLAERIKTKAKSEEEKFDRLSDENREAAR